MAGIGRLFKFQKRAFDRALKANRLKAAERFLLGYAIGLVLIRFTVNGAFALQRVREGFISQGTVMALFNLSLVMLLWTVLPFLMSVTTPSGYRLNPGRLRLMPLSPRQLYLSELQSVVLNPVYWLLAAAFGYGLVPVIISGRGISGVTAGLCLILVCFFLSQAVSFLVQSFSLSGWLRHITGVLLKLLLVVLAAANFDFSWPSNRVVLHVMGFQRLLADFKTASGMLLVDGWWNPLAWLAGRGRGYSAVQAVLTAAYPAGAALLSVMTFRFRYSRLFDKTGVKTPRGGKRFRKTGRYTLFHKELTSYAAGADSWVILILSVILGITVLVKASLDWFIFGVPLIVLLGHRGAFNSLGNDGPAIVRYLGFPQPGVKLLRAKYGAYLGVALIQAAPVYLGAALTLPWEPVVTMAAATLSVLLLYTCAGGCFSILLPEDRSSARKTEGGMGAFAAALAVWGIPYITARWTASSGLFLRLGAQLTLCTFCAAGCFLLLPGMGRWMMAGRESIMRKLTL